MEATAVPQPCLLSPLKVLPSRGIRAQWLMPWVSDPVIALLKLQYLHKKNWENKRANFKDSKDVRNLPTIEHFALRHLYTVFLSFSFESYLLSCSAGSVSPTEHETNSNIISGFESNWERQNYVTSDKMKKVNRNRPRVHLRETLVTVRTNSTRRTKMNRV